ncbi:MAG TPA: acetolactate synthase [Verrucomicrobiae bacterium]|nr:acetolactate synthase [Verrucomicrobiae bacterium]
MTAKILSGRRLDAVLQFSVFTPNRLGRLHELVNLLGSHNIHVLALTVLDTTDSAILRLVLDDPDKARRLLHENGFPFTENGLVAVEVAAPDELNRLFAALLEAELNVNYLYSFIPHPHGKSILALSMEESELAEQVLKRHQFHVLKQSDILR